MSYRVSHRLRALVATLALPAILLAASATSGQEATATAPSIPPEVSANAQQWPLPNVDYANTRSATSTINASNVNQLGVAWTVNIPDVSSFGALATNPIVVDNIVYIEDLTSHVYALNMDDGSVIWDKDYASPSIGPNGVAVGWDKLFVSVGATGIAALDLKTGNEIWNQAIPLGPTEGIDIQPSVYDGLVYISTVPGVSVDNFYKGGASGKIMALNEETGATAWTFDTVDSPDIWGNKDVNSGGGAWYAPAVDTDSGTTYWSVANPAPWPGTPDFPNGSSRPGANLYSDSLVALNSTSGTLNWYTQVKQHDLFDLDLQLSPILGTASINGTQHNVIYTSGKLGVVYAIDRDNGDILWQTPVGQHENDNVQTIPDGRTIRVLPGSLGGVETPMALGSDGLLYVPLLNQPGYYTSTAIGQTDEKYPVTGQLLAIDVNTGAIVWTQNFNQPDYGSATVVNDLVFTATYDGMVYAFNRETGEQVWSWQAPAGVNAFPAVVGDTILIPAGVGTTPQLIALRLGAGSPVGATPEATMSPDMNMTPEAGSTPEANANSSADAGDFSQYLTADATNKTVTVNIIAGMGNINGGLNFNGRDHGGATITVPEGWTVDVKFDNQGTMPHSALVTTSDQLSVVSDQKLAFDGAETANPQNGTAPGSSDEFKFTAATQGDYVIACGIPGHGAAGQWLHFVVGAADVTPSFVQSEPTGAASGGV